MSSATVVIEVVGVHDRVVELWAAEVPRGADGSFRNMTGDHPAFGLLMLAGSNNWNNALAERLGDAPITDPTWLGQHTGEHVEALELGAATPPR
jgi:hypothetical protein